MTPFPPIVQAPDSTQSFNRYTYVMNNPLSMTDPSGYSWLSSKLSKVGKWFNKAGHKIGRWWKKNWRTVVTVIAVIVVSVVTWGAATAWTFGALNFWGAVAVGAAGGATNGAVGTAVYGGSTRQILQAAAKGAAIGAVTAGLTYGVAHGFGGDSLFSQAGATGNVDFVLTKAANGLIGGAASEVDGGDFTSGFVGAFVSGLGEAATGGIKGTNFGAVASRTIVAAAVGGTAAQLAGGSFANGAISAAFSHLVNQEATKAASASDPSWDGRNGRGGLVEDGFTIETEADLAAANAARGGVYVKFAPDSTFTGSNAQGQLGTAMWIDADGGMPEIWSVTSGGHTDRSHLIGQLNRIPDGVWRAGRYRETSPPYLNSLESQAFYRDGYSFKFAIPTPGVNRNGILFHPTPGFTAGCIGHTGSVASMTSFYNRMMGATVGGQTIPVSVR